MHPVTDSVDFVAAAAASQVPARGGGYDNRGSRVVSTTESW